MCSQSNQTIDRAPQFGAFRLLPFTSASLLLLLSVPLSTAAAQTRIHGEGTPTSTGITPSILPGSPAIEGEPFVVDVIGSPGARAMLALTGDKSGFALGRSSASDAISSRMETARLVLDGRGRGTIVLRGWEAGNEITMQAVIEDPTGGTSGTTRSMSVRTLPARSHDLPARSEGISEVQVASSSTNPVGGGHQGLNRLPLTTQVTPAVADVGQQVVISGAQLYLLSGYAAKDIHVISPALSGCIGRVDSVGANSITATITAGSPFPAAAPLSLQGGHGVFTNVPPFGGMTYGLPAYGWTSPDGAPALDTDTSFKTNAQSVFQPCGDPAMFVDLRFRLENGIVKVVLPGMKACKGDTFTIDVSFRFSNGSPPVTSASANISTTVGLPSSSGSWAFDSLYPLFPLSIALATPGCSATYNSATNEIWILAPSGQLITQLSAISYMRINFDPTQHVIVTETHGVNDNFLTTNGPELTTPSAGWDGYVLTHYGIPTRREYDMEGCDMWLRDTFSGYGPGTNGMVRSGNVQMHINGFGCQTDTDAIVLGWDPSASYYYAVGMPQLAVLNFAWNPGDDATLCFDLAQLPVMSASHQLIELRNIVAHADENHLDVGVEDDTTVDYITVKVLRCKNP